MFLNRTRNEQGAAAVEFALILSVLVVILFGITEFGRAFNELETLNSAAREGARVAAVRGSQADVLQAVQDAAVGTPIGPGTPTADKTCTDQTVGQEVSVSWMQEVAIQVPLLPDMSRTVRITGVFRCE